MVPLAEPVRSVMETAQPCFYWSVHNTSVGTDFYHSIGWCEAFESLVSNKKVHLSMSCHESRNKYAHACYYKQTDGNDSHDSYRKSDTDAFDLQCEKGLGFFS